MYYLITGGAGFIGSNIAEKLVVAGEHVRILDNFSSGTRENLSFHSSNDIELIEGDIRNEKDCIDAVKGIDYVIHQAAYVSVPGSIQNPLLNHDTNISGTLNMLLASRESRVKRFVFASSSAVYGGSESATPMDFRPKSESLKLKPISPYAVSKAAGEAYCYLFHKLYGLETVSLRYFNVYGIRQSPHSEYAAVVPKFVSNIIAGKQPTIYGDGKQSRDFIFIDDVVQANLKACTGPQKCVGQQFNIANGISTDILGIIHVLRKLLKIEINPIFAEAQRGDIKHSLADISKAKKLLGFEPKTPIDEGLEKTLEWFRKANP